MSPIDYNHRPSLLLATTFVDMASSSPYDLARKVHLFRSPSFSLPPPITFPTDLHPLPPDLQAYFVYPFSLEAFVIDLTNPNSRTIEELHKSHASYLQWRQEEKQRKEQDRLKRVAPGWASGGTLQPTKRKSMLGESTTTAAASTSSPTTTAASLLDDAHEQTATAAASSAPAQQLDAMADLVEHLARLDAAADERRLSEQNGAAKQS